MSYFCLPAQRSTLFGNQVDVDRVVPKARQVVAIGVFEHRSDVAGQPTLVFPVPPAAG